jgi:hypothetical protein
LWTAEKRRDWQDRTGAGEDGLRILTQRVTPERDGHCANNDGSDFDSPKSAGRQSKKSRPLFGLGLEREDFCLHATDNLAIESYPQSAFPVVETTVVEQAISTAGSTRFLPARRRRSNTSWRESTPEANLTHGPPPCLQRPGARLGFLLSANAAIRRWALEEKLIPSRSPRSVRLNQRGKLQWVEPKCFESEQINLLHRRVILLRGYLILSALTRLARNSTFKRTANISTT